MSVFDVVIIGAGAAGIAAARRLHAAGRRILLLEARDRVGGRCVSDSRLGVPVDLGAAWLHFADENAWTRLAEARGFSVLRRPPGWGPDAGVGARSPSSAERAAAHADYRRYFDLVSTAARQGRDVAVADVVSRDAFRPRFDAVMTWAVGMESDAVSTIDLDRYADSDANWAVREGLGTVVADAAAGLPVHLEAAVTHIDWSGDTVRIDSGAGRMEAHAVIVTLPTSLLARDAIRFHPPLPDAHRAAIEALPLGVCNKVYFRLRRPDGVFGGAHRHFIGSADTSRTCSWEVRAADQPVLLAYFGGDLSIDCETRGELEHFARGELRGIFGTQALDELGDAVSTAWGGDPFALGSYSAARPGRAEARGQLALPVSPRLHFAGEACSVHHYGTIHGAWLSGVAAADRLLRK